MRVWAWTRLTLDKKCKCTLASPWFLPGACAQSVWAETTTHISFPLFLNKLFLLRAWLDPAHTRSLSEHTLRPLSFTHALALPAPVIQRTLPPHPQPTLPLNGNHGLLGKVETRGRPRSQGPSLSPSCQNLQTCALEPGANLRSMDTRALGPSPLQFDFINVRPLCSIFATIMQIGISSSRDCQLTKRTFLARIRSKSTGRTLSPSDSSPSPLSPLSPSPPLRAVDLTPSPPPPAILLSLMRQIHLALDHAPHHPWSPLRKHLHGHHLPPSKGLDKLNLQEMSGSR